MVFPGMAEQLHQESLRNQQEYNFEETITLPQASNSSANPVPGNANATAGYLSVNDPNNFSKLFYIFYECRNRTTPLKAGTPIIVWLQGGAGGSSMAGNFIEMGPFKLTRNSSGGYQETRRNSSWNDYYHMLFIDNPRGTGYSIADKNSFLSNGTQVAKDFVQALLSFYKVGNFTQYAATPLYIFGESFAGHYIPSIARAIIDYNSKATVKIPLKGIAIGNAWVDPINQIKENGLFAYTLGLADDIQRAQIEFSQLDVYFSISNGRLMDALNRWHSIITYTQQIGGGLNMYDYRDFGSHNFSYLETYMNYNATCKKYSVDTKVCGKFVDVNSNVTAALYGDFMVSYAKDVAYALTNGLSAMFYVGQDDFIVNSANAQNWIGNLTWKGQQAFYDAPMQPWIMNNGSTVGLAKQAQGLTYVVVDKAGHIAPMQQIDATSEMVRRFITNSKNWTAPIK